MLKLLDGLLELYKKVATSLPSDVEDSLKKAYEAEAPGTNAKNTLAVILENITIARKTARPICQDTGIPVFYVKVPATLSQMQLKNLLFEATRISTENIPLRPNAVDILTDRNSGDNTGTGFPVIYMDEAKDSTLTIDLMLKGAGCENAGQTYRLPSEELNAERDLEGVRRCVLDTVYKAQGRGCPPYILGVGIGGAKDQVAALAKSQLRRRLNDKSPYETISVLEERLLNEVNSLGIGPLGIGGKTTTLGIKIDVNHRHPASYFVDVSVSCWAMRRARLVW